MRKLSNERRKVVLLACTVACMSSGPVLLRGHQILILVWLAVMLAALTCALVLFGKLRRQGL